MIQTDLVLRRHLRTLRNRHVAVHETQRLTDMRMLNIRGFVHFVINDLWDRLMDRTLTDAISLRGDLCSLCKRMMRCPTVTSTTKTTLCPTCCLRCLTQYLYTEQLRPKQSTPPSHVLSLQEQCIRTLETHLTHRIISPNEEPLFCSPQRVSYKLDWPALDINADNINILTFPQVFDTALEYLGNFQLHWSSRVFHITGVTQFPTHPKLYDNNYVFFHRCVTPLD